LFAYVPAVKIDAHGNGFGIAGLMMHFSVSDLEVRVYIRDASIQHVFYEWAEPAVGAAADEYQLVAMTKLRSHIAVLVADHALRGSLYPAAEASDAGADTAVVGYDAGIFILREERLLLRRRQFMDNLSHVFSFLRAATRRNEQLTMHNEQCMWKSRRDFFE
jgi:hypothetical protein